MRAPEDEGARRARKKDEIDGGEALLLLVGTLIVLHGLLIAGALLTVAVHGGSVVGAATRDPLGPALAQLAALGLALFIGVRLVHGPDASLRESLQVVPVAPRVVLLSLLAGFALQFPLVALSAWTSELVPALARPEEMERMIEAMMRIDGPARAVTVPLAIVVIAPVSEELLFRGLLLPALARRYGSAIGVLASALAFGAFHLDPLALGYATLAGLVLGVLALRTRSVLPGIALHAAFNAAPVALPRELVAIEGFNTDGGPMSAWILATSLAIAAIALGLVHRATR